MKTPRRRTTVAILGTLAIGSSAAWAVAARAADASREEAAAKAEACDKLAPPSRPSLTTERLTPAKRAAAVRIALADPDVRDLLAGWTPQEQTGPGPGYRVFPRALNQPGAGEAIQVTFSMPQPVSGAHTVRILKQGFRIEDCAYSETISLRTQRYSGEATQATQVLAEVSLKLGRAIAVDLSSFRVGASLGAPEYLVGNK